MNQHNFAYVVAKVDGEDEETDEMRMSRSIFLPNVSVYHRYTDEEHNRPVEF
jgi:hypothetical protein